MNRYSRHFKWILITIIDIWIHRRSIQLAAHIKLLIIYLAASWAFHGDEKTHNLFKIHCRQWHWNQRIHLISEKKQRTISFYHTDHSAELVSSQNIDEAFLLKFMYNHYGNNLSSFASTGSFSILFRDKQLEYILNVLRCLLSEIS